MEVKSLEEVEKELRDEMGATVEADNPLKELFIEYVGEKLQPEDGAVSVEMCLQVFAEEFPEFLAPVCEQNFMLGYLQCERDVTALMISERSETPEEEVSE